MKDEIAIGDKFGHWEITGSQSKKKSRYPKRILAKCTLCNKTIKPVTIESLLTGKSKSCGCWRKEQQRRLITNTTSQNQIKEEPIKKETITPPLNTTVKIRINDNMKKELNAITGTLSSKIRTAITLYLKRKRK